MTDRLNPNDPDADAGVVESRVQMERLIAEGTARGPRDPGVRGPGDRASQRRSLRSDHRAPRFAGRRLRSGPARERPAALGGSAPRVLRGRIVASGPGPSMRPDRGRFLPRADVGLSALDPAPGPGEISPHQDLAHAIQRRRALRSQALEDAVLTKVSFESSTTASVSRASFAGTQRSSRSICATSTVTPRSSSARSSFAAICAEPTCAKRIFAALVWLDVKPLVPSSTAPHFSSRGHRCQNDPTSEP